MANITERKHKDGTSSYLIRVHRGRDHEGKQLKPYTTTWTPSPNMSAAKIQKELAKYATIFEDKCKRGLISSDKQSFYEYAKYVIEYKESGGLKHRTASRYRDLLNRINDISVNGFGFLKLSEIRPDILNKFYKSLSKDGSNKKTGAALSPKTILEHHRFISTVFSQAMKEGLVINNPAERAAPPRVPRKEATAFELEEIKTIIKKVEEDTTQWQVITHLFIGSGARRGEILGLRWSDIDFEKSQIHLCNNLLYSKERGIYEDTLKTAESRFVTVADNIIELLKKHRAEQIEQLKAIGNKCVYKGHIFTQWNGKPMHPDSITDYFSKLSKKCGFHINPHKFRHTQASLLINKGVDIVTVSKRLGHSKVSTTTDIYAHMINKADENANKVVADLIYKTV